MAVLTASNQDRRHNHSFSHIIAAPCERSQKYFEMSRKGAVRAAWRAKLPGPLTLGGDRAAQYL